MTVLKYLEENREQLMDRLFTFLQIPSISTDSKYKNDVKKTAQFVYDYLEEIGFHNVEIMETEGHPLVYAEWLELEDAPTVLFYGHYDVQPVDPLDEWISDPF